MSGMLTMSGWHTLIDGNLEWLSTLDRTLERDHVIDCMRLLRGVRPSVIDLRADGINNLKEENAALRAKMERLEGERLRLREATTEFAQTQAAYNSHFSSLLLQKGGLV